MKTPLLKHPLTILISVAIGALIGLFNAPISGLFGVNNFAQAISFPGQLYLFYLQMTVIPIIITAISSSLGKLIRDKSSAGLIKRIVVVFLVCMAGCAVIGMVLGIFGKPGSGLDENTRSLLSNLISSSDGEGIRGALEMNLGAIEETAAAARPGMGNFFRDLIPANIFQALSLGSTLAIVFFSIIFGVAIGSLAEESASQLITLLSSIFQAFQKLINWSLYLLPFGLICLLAGQIAAVGIQIFMAMSKFITLYCAGTVIIFVICTLIMWIRSGNPNPLKVIPVLFEPVLLAFATRNSMATLPSAISCLDDELKFDSTAINLTLPLGMTLGRFGNIFYFALGTFFVVQIYDMPLEIIHYLIILIGVIFSGTATAGASGIVTLSMMSIVLDPLRLPMEAILIIFMAIDPIIDPFRTFLIVYVNMAAAALIAKRRGAESASARTLGANLPAIDPRQEFLVCIRKSGEQPRPKNFEDVELRILGEIARRLGRRFVLSEEPSFGLNQSGAADREADITGGLVVRTDAPPVGFSFSQPWAQIVLNGVKRQFCFLLPWGSPDSGGINDIIKALSAEKFLKTAAGNAAGIAAYSGESR